MPKARKYSLAAPLGAAILALALVGAIFLCTLLWRTVSSVLDNSGTKAELEEQILPVLMFDPISFDSVETADPLMLLQSSIWEAVMSDTSGKYTIELGEYLNVSETDVDAAAARLFGPNVKLTHQTFGEMELNYYYNENTHSYYVPLYSQVGYYLPSVEKIDKLGYDVYALTVGYVAPNNGILISLENSKQEPDKYMMYNVRYDREKKAYYIMSLREMPRTDGNSAASVAAAGE